MSDGHMVQLCPKKKKKNNNNNNKHKSKKRKTIVGGVGEHVEREKNIFFLLFASL